MSAMSTASASELYDGVEKGPVFTAQDEQNDVASLSINDIISVQADLSGMSTLQISDGSSSIPNAAAIPRHIALLNQEISKLPDSQTSTYYRAVEAGLVSHEHKLMFLEHDRGNAEEAARKIARYWDLRLSVFGPDRCFLPMTLKGAMKEQAVPMLKSGIMQLLPVTDTAGRSVLYYCPSRRNLSEFNTQQELMCTWFLTETIMEAPELRRRGMVILINQMNTTPYHYSSAFVKICGEMQRCMPVTMRATHICHQSRMFNYVIHPMARYLLPKSTRVRTKVHYGTTGEILMSLATHCLPRSRLPTELGGEIVLDMGIWLKNRMSMENSARPGEGIHVPREETASANIPASMNDRALKKSRKEYPQDMTLVGHSSHSTLTSAIIEPPGESRRVKKGCYDSLGQQPFPPGASSIPVTPSSVRSKGAGRRGDPRMERAIEIKLENPTMPLYDVLVAGGFVFRTVEGRKDMVDTDGICLQQRKNNLCRRIRCGKMQQQETTHEAKPAVAAKREGGPSDSEEVKVNDSSDWQGHRGQKDRVVASAGDGTSTALTAESSADRSRSVPPVVGPACTNNDDSSPSKKHAEAGAAEALLEMMQKSP